MSRLGEKENLCHAQIKAMPRFELTVIFERDLYVRKYRMFLRISKCREYIAP